MKNHPYKLTLVIDSISIINKPIKSSSKLPDEKKGKNIMRYYILEVSTEGTTLFTQPSSIIPTKKTTVLNFDKPLQMIVSKWDRNTIDQANIILTLYETDCKATAWKQSNTTINYYLNDTNPSQKSTQSSFVMQQTNPKKDPTTQSNHVGTIVCSLDFEPISFISISDQILTQFSSTHFHNMLSPSLTLPTPEVKLISQLNLKQVSIPPHALFRFFSVGFLIFPAYQQALCGTVPREFSTFLKTAHNVIREGLPTSQTLSHSHTSSHTPPPLTSIQILNASQRPEFASQEWCPSKSYTTWGINRQCAGGGHALKTLAQDRNEISHMIPSHFEAPVPPIVDIDTFPLFRYGMFPIAKLINVHYTPIHCLPRGDRLIGIFVKHLDHQQYHETLLTQRLLTELSGIPNHPTTSPLISLILPYFWIHFIQYELTKYQLIHHSASFLGHSTMVLLNFCLGDNIVHLSSKTIAEEVHFSILKSNQLNEAAINLLNSHSMDFVSSKPQTPFTFLHKMLTPFPHSFPSIITTYDTVYFKQYQYWSVLLSSGLSWMVQSPEGNSLHELAMSSFQTLVVEHAALTFHALTHTPMITFPSFKLQSSSSAMLASSSAILESKPELMTAKSFQQHLELISSQFIPPFLTTIPNELIELDTYRTALTNFLPLPPSSKPPKELLNLIDSQTTLPLPPPLYKFTALTIPTTPPHILLNMMLGYTTFLPPLPRLRESNESLVSALFKTTNLREFISSIKAVPTPYHLDQDPYAFSQKDTKGKGGNIRSKITYRSWCLVWLFYGYMLYPYMIEYQYHHFSTLADFTDCNGEPTYRWKHICTGFPEDNEIDGTFHAGYNVLHESLFAAVLQFDAKGIRTKMDEIIHLTPAVPPQEIKAYPLDKFLRCVHEKLLQVQGIIDVVRWRHQSDNFTSIHSQTIFSPAKTFIPANITISQAMDVIDYTTEYTSSIYEYCGNWLYQTKGTAQKSLKSSFLRTSHLIGLNSTNIDNTPCEKDDSLVDVQSSSHFQPLGLVFSALNQSPSNITLTDDIPTLLQGYSIRCYDKDGQEGDIVLLNPSFVAADPNSSLPFSNHTLLYSTQASPHNHAQLMTSNTALYTLLNHEVSQEYNIHIGTTTLQCELLLYAILRRVNENILMMFFNRIEDKSLLLNLKHHVFHQSLHRHEIIKKRLAIAYPFTNTEFTNDSSNITTYCNELTFESCLLIAATGTYAPGFVQHALDTLAYYR